MSPVEQRSIPACTLTVKCGLQRDFLCEQLQLGLSGQQPSPEEGPSLLGTWLSRTLSPGATAMLPAITELCQSPSIHH